MRKAFFQLLTSILFLSVGLSDQYSVNLYFEQTEEALSTLFKTQVFPHPLGDHDGDDYDIYLWNPSVDIEPGIVNFSFTIYADVVIAGIPIHYEYPFILPLNIPAGELSVSGIISYLEGIPDQINDMEGQQWIKDIIIAEYEGLELTVYPNSLLEDATSTIPDFIDVSEIDFGLSFDILSDKLQFTITLEYTVNAPWFEVWYNEYADTFAIKFKSNVEREVLFFQILTIDLLIATEVVYPDITLTPNEWYIVSMEGTLPPGQYIIQIVFGSEYGWTGQIYTFADEGSTYWRQMTFSSEF